MMRDYVKRQSSFQSAAYCFRRIRLVLRNIVHRKALAHLDRMTPYQLKDIGLTHEDLRRMGNLPLSVDLDWEVERLNLIASRRVSSTKNR